MTAVIEVGNVHKRYGGMVAVDDVSFTVDEAEIFGILGPNGAGKTTTVECIEGLRTPDCGRIRVLGLDPRTDATELHQQLGVQLQESELPERIEVGEALELYSSFYRTPADWVELMRTLGLDSKRRTQYRKLSPPLRVRDQAGARKPVRGPAVGARLAAGTAGDSPAARCPGRGRGTLVGSQRRRRAGHHHRERPADAPRDRGGAAPDRTGGPGQRGQARPRPPGRADPVLYGR